MISAENQISEKRASDPRWQLTGRIVATEPFRKSTRFRELLEYLVERAIANRLDDLSETRIGHAVFGKPLDYSPTEDSTVRVQIRQLRLKLHEYFDVSGRSEPLTLEIPKGGFVPVFTDNLYVPPVSAAVLSATSSIPEPVAVKSNSRAVPLLAALVVLLALTCAFLLVRLHFATETPSTPWPLSVFTGSSDHTTIIMADVNYGMLNIIQSRHRSLQEYLNTVGQDDTSNGLDNELLHYINESSLTSSADAVIAASLSSLMSNSQGQTSVRSARDIRPRDLDIGNFIFLGSAASNPWVAVFQDQLNFEEVMDGTGRYYGWKNKAPKPGEEQTYKCLVKTGTSGDDYADIALLPSQNGRGAVLILQGGQQEGTESTLVYLNTEQGRVDLLRALGYSKPPSKPTYFEALIRTQVIAGAPRTTHIVATRLMHRPS